MMSWRSVVGLGAYLLSVDTTPIPDGWLHYVLQLGALGVLLAVLFWNRQAERVRVKDITKAFAEKNEVIESKDAYLRQMVDQFTALVKADIQTRADLTSALLRRPCLREDKTIPRIEMGQKPLDASDARR